MQVLLLKASAAPKEAMTDIAATALDMLKQDPTQYQVLSTAAELLQTSKEQGTSVPGAILEVGPAKNTDFVLYLLVPQSLPARGGAGIGVLYRELSVCQGKSMWK
jgi:hypothetical protein